MSQTIFKSPFARGLLTVAFVALLWAIRAPLAHLVPHARYRVLGLVFVSVAFIWRVWPNVARGIGNFQARLLLTIMYAIFVLPIGTLVRLFADPLRIKRSPTSWLDYSEQARDMSWAKRQ